MVRRAWAGMALLALPTVLLGLDVTVLYLALPEMAADLGPSATQTLWIMDAYGFLLAGFLVTMGTLGDRVGRRRLLMVGITAFAAVSVGAAFAPSAELLIAARALLGIAGATLMPSTLSLISNMFPDPRRRAVAIGVWATMFALGMAAGPIVGGVLVDAFWWGAAFLVAVPIAVAVLALGRVLLPEYTDPRAGRPDLTSVGLSLAAILPVVYAVKHLASDGLDAGAAVAVPVGVIAGVLFWRRQRRLDDPLLDVALFTNRAFGMALTVLLIGLVGVGGTMYLVTQYLQVVEGLSPFAAGLWMGPPALAMFAAGIGAPLLARRVRPGHVMGATLGVSLIGYALLATAGLDDELPVAAGFAFVYLGLGAIAALGTDIVVGAAPASKSGSAASLSETVQELGIAIGVALLGSLTTAVYRAQPTEARLAFTTGMNLASAVAGIAIAAAAVLCFRALRHVPRLGHQPPTILATEEGDVTDRVDGRLARGARRRAEIIDATLAVVTRDGAAGVTHRTVAKQAGITTSLSTYYFATLDDLLVAALTSVADTYTTRIRQIIDGDGDKLTELAELIAETAGPGRDRALAERELATLAARRPALRPVARRWRENIAELAATLTDDPTAVAALVAASDGLCTAILLDNGPADPHYLRAVLQQALTSGDLTQAR